MALTCNDFPLAETAPDSITGGRGKPLGALTLAAVEAGEITMQDLRITSGALLAQAQIARDAGRAALAANFERGAELVPVPDALLMDTYELLRPGRAKNRQALLERAALFRREYGAEQIAQFLETAAAQYFRRGMIPD